MPEWDTLVAGPEQTALAGVDVAQVFAASYRKLEMEDLEAGTYELTPSRDGTEPTVLLTVPDGWNSWEGPNRFDGHREGDSNEEALARSTWLVGVTVLDVQGVATERCQPTVGATGFDLPYHQTIRAVRDIPGYEATVDRSGGDGLFGHPSTSTT